MDEERDLEDRWYPVLIWGGGVIIAVLVLGSLVFTGASCGPIYIEGRVHSENIAYNLKTAISTFYTEYRRYPLGEEKSVVDFDGDSSEDLMVVLLGMGDGDLLNPRKIAFYAGKEAKRKWGGRVTKGIEYSEDRKSAKLRDYWGNLYRVRLDTNQDNRVTNPADPSQQLPETILIWSAGKDGDLSTWKDNIKTW